MKIVNLTPHNVVICDDDGNIIKTYAASGKVARVVTNPGKTYFIDEVPTREVESSTTIGLLPPEEGTLYIVSRITLVHHPDRKDLIAPIDRVFGYGGKIIGCRGFQRNG